MPEDCEVCKVKFQRHPRCSACGILSGDGHEGTDLRRYRGHMLCESCIRRWKILDKEAGRNITWEESLKGTKVTYEQEC